MKTFSDAGIYTFIDLSIPQESINRESPSWTTDLQDTYIKTIDVFAKYDNVLAYNVGNEVVVAANGTAAGAFIKAAARDIKAYLKSKSINALVGYAAVDAPKSWRNPFADYLSCDISGQNSGDTSVDIYGLNNYEWCGNSTFANAWQGTNNDYANSKLAVAAYLSEFGCLNPSGGPRSWQEVGSLFSSDMSGIWSGGIAFNYFPAQSAAGQFGMVTISFDGSTVNTSQDFDNLKSEYGSVSPPSTPTKSNAPAATYAACPAQSTDLLASTTLPPTPVDSACNCMEQQLSCIFTPAVSNQTVVNQVIGQLLDYGCNLLGQNGGSCNDIAGSGSAGTYGLGSSCSPAVKLSYVFSQFYENQKKNQDACNFAGNATINRGASATANAVASSCMASATGTSVPVASSASGSSSSTSSTNSPTRGSGNSNGNNGAVTLIGSSSAAGVVAMMAVSLLAGAMTLA